MNINGLQSLTNEQILSVINFYQQNTDEYIFFWDLTTDICYFSQSSVEKFNEKTTQWKNYSKSFCNNIYIDDIKTVNKSIGSCIIGKASSFKTQYRRIITENKYIWLEAKGHVTQSADNHKLLIGSICEIGRKQIADNKTGLKKRDSFIKELNQILLKDPNSINYILRIDIDNFKKINERDGFVIGDRIIASLSKLILENINKKYARAYTLDSDEFIIIDIDPEKKDNPIQIYNQLKAEVVQSIRKDSLYTFYTISASAMFENFEEKNANNILEMTEFSLTNAKNNGRNQIKFYDEEQYKNNLKKLDIEKRVRANIVKGCDNVTVYFQPIVDSNNNYKIIGAEALIRYTDEIYGNVPPVVLVPMLEETGLIIPVGRYVLKTASKMCLEWRKLIPNFHINVNLSYIQIMKSNIMYDINKILDEIELPYNAITLEITESGFIESDPRIMEMFQLMRCKNIKLALDDFGTGYSNMRYLDDIKADTIKFDRNFTNQAVNNEYDFIVIKHMIDLVHSIGGKVCVEGIETTEELNKMKDLNPDMIQGYLFGKPVPAEEFTKLLQNNI